MVYGRRVQRGEEVEAFALGARDAWQGESSGGGGGWVMFRRQLDQRQAVPSKYEAAGRAAPARPSDDDDEEEEEDNDGLDAGDDATDGAMSLLPQLLLVRESLLLSVA